MPTKSPDYLSALDVAPDGTRFDLLPPHVTNALKGREFVVFRVPDDASDTVACTERFGIPLENGANTIIVRFKKGGAEYFAAVVGLTSTRIDVNGAVRRALGAARISFAPREDSVAGSGMEYGGITAFGLPSDWPVLVDTAVMDRESIVMGAGVRAAKLLLSPSALLTIPGVSVTSLAKQRSSVEQA